MAEEKPNRMQVGARVVYDARRRVATALAVGLAILFGYHAIFGQNGITAYAEKRSEDKQLRSRIERLSKENVRLQEHVDHLQSDPETIELEARERLHYTRAGEVIYSLEDGRKADASPAMSGPAPRH